jgi:hypothetical protein
MSTSVEKITQEVERLTPKEQQLLLVKLTSMLEENLDADIKQEWLKVAKRRLEEIRNGEVELISGEEVMRDAKARLE